MQNQETEKRNTVRSLVLDGRVSLTVVNATSLAKKGIKTHGFTGKKAEYFSRSLAIVAFMSSWLKQEKGKISVSVKDGNGATLLSLSGDAKMRIRGCLDGIPDKNGTLTLIRDDGYRIPFVGTCMLTGEDVDEDFENYFFASEQLPTYISSRAKFDSRGRLVYCGCAVLQPLPFSTEKDGDMCADKSLRARILDGAEKSEDAVLSVFPDADTMDEKTAKYRCTCSKVYIKSVLMTLGKEELLKIAKEEGKIQVHCHDCNKDYSFTAEEAESFFAPKKRK